jgi:hypothetical protein
MWVAWIGCDVSAKPDGAKNQIIGSRSQDLLLSSLIKGRLRRGNILMKISRILAVAGTLTLLACGAAFAQSPNQIPVGAGVAADRQPAGFGWRDPTKSSSTAAQPSATGKRTIVARTRTRLSAAWAKRPSRPPVSALPPLF